MTLVELMVATALSGIIFAAVATLMFHSARSFAALTNYVDLDGRSRNALDRMSSEIRQVDRLTSYSTNKLVFQGTDPASGSSYTLTYQYDPVAETLTRTLGGTKTVLLSECTFLNFSIFKRNPIGGTYDWYDTAITPAECKLIQLTWICTREILQKKANTESVQSAKFVIRKA